MDAADVGGAQEVEEKLFLLQVAWDRAETGALRDGLLEWRGAVETAECGDLVHDRATAGGFAEHGHAVWVTAKQVDIVANPLQSETLVVQARVGCTVRLQGRPGEPAKGS